jgi:hypothetical protein
MPLAEAVVDAGAVRFRPMMLTAAAVIVGTSVLLFDPIFQGLAVSLMAGEAASLLLSRMAVPILYYLSETGNRTEFRIPLRIRIYRQTREMISTARGALSRLYSAAWGVKFLWKVPLSKLCATGFLKRLCPFCAKFTVPAHTDGSS